MSTNKILYIDDDDVSFNRYYNALYHQCDVKERMPALYGNYSSEFYQCGANSMALVSYVTESGTPITKHVCERHLAEYINKAKELNRKIVDQRKERS